MKPSRTRFAVATLSLLLLLSGSIGQAGFFDWTHVFSATSGDPLTAGLDATVTHIEAVKSLFYQTTSGPNPNNPVALSGYTAGVVGNDSSVRSMFRVDQNSGSPVVAVWTEMQGSIATSSTAYYLIWTTDPLVQIWKATGDQIALGSGTLLASMGSPPAFIRHDIYALSLQNHYDGTSGTMFLSASIDTTPIASPDTYDFSTLTEVLTFSDTSAPLIGGLTDGVGFMIRGGGPGSNTETIDFDVTQIHTP